MTTSHEPSAPLGAGDRPGEKLETPIADVSAASRDRNGAQAAAREGAPSAPATEGIASTAIDPVGDTSSTGGEDADNLDDLDEGLDDYEEYEEDGGPAWLSTALSYLRWPPSRRAIYTVGAIILVIALLLPAILVGIGARGAGPLAVHPTPTITPTATATPPQNVAVQDPLNKRSTRWPENQACSMRADGYHVTDNSICFLAGPPIRDSYITVTVLQIAGVDDLSYGITLRRAAEGNYYSFEIDGSGRWYFYKSAVDSNGSPVLTLLASHADNPSINKGVFHANTLQVRAIGPHFEFYVNNVKVGQANDSSYAVGAIGLGGNDQLEVVYMDLTLTQPA